LYRTRKRQGKDSLSAINPRPSLTES
jgi:hypothetical protein